MHEREAGASLRLIIQSTSNGVQTVASTPSYQGSTCFFRYETTFEICTRTLSGLHLEKHQRYIQCIKHEAAILGSPQVRLWKGRCSGLLLEGCGRGF